MARFRQRCRERRRYVLRLVALVAIGLADVGCGYTLGYQAPPDGQSIAVPIFHNSTFPLRRDIEFELTSLVRRELQTRTDLVVLDSGESDLVLRGNIVEFRETIVVEGEFDAKVESTLYVDVEVALEDYVHGTRIVQRVQRSEPFSLAAGESFETGRQSALVNLAERIVAAVSFWGESDDPDGSDSSSAGTDG